MPLFLRQSRFRDHLMQILGINFMQRVIFRDKFDIRNSIVPDTVIIFVLEVEETESCVVTDDVLE